MTQLFQGITRVGDQLPDKYLQEQKEDDSIKEAVCIAAQAKVRTPHGSERLVQGGDDDTVHKVIKGPDNFQEETLTLLPLPEKSSPKASINLFRQFKLEEPQVTTSCSPPEQGCQNIPKHGFLLPPEEAPMTPFKEGGLCSGKRKVPGPNYLCLKSTFTSKHFHLLMRHASGCHRDT